MRTELLSDTKFKNPWYSRVLWVWATNGQQDYIKQVQAVGNNDQNLKLLHS